MRYVLDSTFLIDHLRGLPEATAKLRAMFEDNDEPFVTEIVVCEVRAGLRPSDEHHLIRLLEPLELVQPGPDAAIIAGRWRHDLRSQGRTLSLGDALIAAAAVSLDATVLTRNVKDFALTAVRVERY